MRSPSLACFADHAAYMARMLESPLPDAAAGSARVHDAEAQLAGANAALEEQHQKVEKLKQKLDEATVLAPADGKVLLPLHHEGELIQDGQVILQIISSDDLYLRFAIPGDQAGTIATKDEVDVLVVQPNITTKAIVRNVLPQLDPVAQMIIADADLVGPTDKLQGGQRCRILPRPKK